MYTGLSCELVQTGKYSVFEALFGTTFKCVQEGQITLGLVLHVLILELLFLLSYYITHKISYESMNKAVLGFYGIFLATMIGIAAYPFVDFFFLS